MVDPCFAAPRRSPLPVLGRLIEPLYAAGVSRRNARFDARGGNRFADAAGRNIPVISIGNLSVGGTGKTPMVMHTLNVLMEHGRWPCVAMRGYTKSASGAPDETDAYRRAFPSLPVVAQPDRSAGLRALLANTSVSHHPDCIVLDDGFQHRQIARDVDVVLIDATPGRSVFEDRLLPAGWLREPVSSLKRASAVVLTHAELASDKDLETLREMMRRHTDAPTSVTRHVWTGLKMRKREEKPGSENRGTQDEMLPLDVLIGRRVVGCCAIGNPTAFTRSLARTVNPQGRAATELVLRVLPDHDPFSSGTVAEICTLARQGKAEYIVVTDKDWSKLRHVPEGEWPCPVVRPELAVVFDEGREGFEGLVMRAGGT